MLNSYFCNTLFKVKSFEDYVDLIEKLGLNICGYSPYRKYWMPSFKRTEQVEVFGKMYKAKIKELLGVE